MSDPESTDNGGTKKPFVQSLALAFYGIPATPKKNPIEAIGRNAYLRSFKQVLLNKSAVACLFGTMFFYGSSVWSFFAATFWRQQFHLLVESVAVITLGITLVFAAGSLVGGRLVNRVGRKRLLILTGGIRSLLIPLIVLMPDFYLALLMCFLASAFGGLALAAGPSLTLEQAPESRGTMMSINTVFGSLGGAIGASLGGDSFRAVWIRCSRCHLRSLKYHSSLDHCSPSERPVQTIINDFDAFKQSISFAHIEL
jgi:predicted MFS family arabinose efflux permease